jgi:hypothetical protein
MKVVIDRCYGGFGLSHEAVMRYFEIKGITVYPEQGEGVWKFWTYWTVKPEDRIESKEGKDYYDGYIEIGTSEGLKKEVRIQHELFTNTAFRH